MKRMQQEVSMHQVTESTENRTLAAQNYKRAEFALKTRAGFCAQVNISMNAEPMRVAISDFKKAREARFGKENTEEVNALVTQLIGEGQQQMRQQISQFFPPHSDPAPAATRPIHTAGLQPTANVAASVTHYIPKPKEGLTEIAAQKRQPQQALVTLAKHALCDGNTDDRSAELMTAIAIARHNPKTVKQIDLIRQDVPLEMPDMEQFGQYVSQIKSAGVLKGCRVSYVRDVQGRDVGHFFPQQHTPQMASAKAASK